MSEPVLSVKNLTVALSRDGRESLVLDGLNFDVTPGEVVAIVGGSGSGKSTLGLALQGLLPRDSQPKVGGTIRIFGTEIVGARETDLRKARRTLVRAIPQDPMGGLDPTMIVRRQMAESTGSRDEVIGWLERTGVANPSRVAEALPHNLSGGQRQRVLIAMGMMSKPKLLVADEPTTALDVTTQAQILDLLRSMAREQQTAILFITHDLGVAASLASRVIVLYAGRIAEVGHVRDILGTPAHPYSVGLLAARFDLTSNRHRPLPVLPPERDRVPEPAYACSYARRCPMVREDCWTIRPSLRRTVVHPGTVACHRAEETPTRMAEAAAAAPWSKVRIEDRVVLRFAGVGKNFGKGTRPVINSIDLAIRYGECVALVGESGSGKTTLLRIAAGLLAPDRGQIRYNHSRSPQVVFQDAPASFTPWLTIGEQVAERLRAYPMTAAARHSRVAETFALVGLDPALMEVLPGELSGGQCQRAAVARAIIVPPNLLLCDEPISAIDVSLAATTLNLLGSIRRQLGMAMLFVTHDLAAARIIADRIVVLHDGGLIEDSDPDTLIGSPGTSFARSLIAAIPNLTTELTR